jgi:outer membrane protein assembly factor BamB
MKILSIVIGFLFITAFTSGQRSPEPITKFLKLKWEVKIDTKSTLPAISGRYLLTADNFAIDTRTGEKLSLSSIDYSIDTFLIHSTDYKLNVTDLKNSSSKFERIRSRPYYIGPKQVELHNDSIWVEVTKNTSIQGVNLLNQKIIWTTRSNSRIFNRPVTIGDKVYISNLNQLLTLDKLSGIVIDSLPLRGPVLSGIEKYKDFIYTVVEDEGLIALNHNTKEIKWKIALSKYSSRANRIVIDENRVYFSDRNLYAVDRSNGRLLWQVGEKEGVYIRDSGLSEVKDYLIFYVLEENENLLTVADKSTGEILYQGINSNVVGRDNDVPFGRAKEDLLLIDFMDEIIDDNILIGVLDNKIYGFEILK